MAEAVVGIKETKEALVGVMDLSSVIIKTLKADGLSFAAAIDLFKNIEGNAVLLAELKVAFDGISQVPSEIGDLSASETVELVVAVAEKVPALVAAFNTEKKAVA